MRSKLSFFIALLVLLTLPIMVAAEASAPQGVTTIAIAPDPIAQPASGATEALNATINFQYNDDAGGNDNIARFCLYVPSANMRDAAITAGAVTLQVASGGFGNPTAVAFTPTDGIAATVCPAAYGANAILYTSAADVALDGGERTVTGSIPLELDDTVAPGGYTYTMLLEESSSGVNPGTDSHTVGTPLSVRLESFEATTQGDHILVTWATSLEIDNLGFNLYRNSIASVEEVGQVLNTELIASQAPGSGQGFMYEFKDYDVEAGVTYYYSLEDIDTNGTHTVSGPIAGTYAPPTAVEMSTVSANSSPVGALPLGLMLLVSAGAIFVWRRSR